MFLKYLTLAGAMFNSSNPAENFNSLLCVRLFDELIDVLVYPAGYLTLLLSVTRR